MNNAKCVDANPTKDFFIYMITRDIETKPAIVELIDNAIDGAKKLRKDGSYVGLVIDLKYDQNSFTIKDNCGGFDLDVATKYAFKFGRPRDRVGEKGLFTGLFGIGMKRALFKLGEKFTVISTTEKTHFKVEVDVNEWILTPDWKFPLQDVVENGYYSEEQRGTTIIIEKLHNEQKYNFANKKFENSLFSYIEKYRSVESGNGLVIKLNGKEISFFKENLIENDYIKCYKSYCEYEGGLFRIIAGVAHNGEPEKAGWYIFCNGRLVLFADKSNVTGWGVEYKQYHPSLASFRGYVYFESENLFQLPWNTTKTGVDSTNRLYQEALTKMKEAVEQVGSAITSVKNKYDVNNINEIEIIKNASEISLSYATVHSFSSGSDFSIIDPEPVEKMTSITFKVPEERYNAVKEYMKTNSKKEMGNKLFEYFCEMEGI